MDLFHELYCSGSMCVGVAVWFGWGGVVSLCRLKLCFNKTIDIKLVYLYSTIKMMHVPKNLSFLSFEASRPILGPTPTRMGTGRSFPEE